MHPKRQVTVRNQAKQIIEDSVYMFCSNPLIVNLHIHSTGNNKSSPLPSTLFCKISLLVLTAVFFLLLCVCVCVSEQINSSMRRQTEHSSSSQQKCVWIFQIVETGLFRVLEELLLHVVTPSFMYPLHCYFLCLQSFVMHMRTLKKLIWHLLTGIHGKEICVIQENLTCNLN